MNKRVACVLLPSANLTPDQLQNFAEACLRFTPEIALHNSNAVFLEIGKCANLYSEDLFQKRIKVLIRRFDKSWLRDARVAIEPDATRALISARFGHSDITRALALESFYDFADPFGKFPPEGRKPITLMIERLQSLGITSLNEFMQIPANELPSRFGPISQHLRTQIEWSANSVWPRWSPRETIEEKIELADHDYCQSLEPVLFYSKQALDRLHARLQGRALRCSTLEVTLKLERYSTVREPNRKFKFEFMMPQGTSRGTLPILQERWEKEFRSKPLESAVLQLHFAVQETTPGYDRQANLFHNRDEIEEAYHSIVAHLAESVGSERVFGAIIREERFPERSWKKREHLSHGTSSRADHSHGTRADHSRAADHLTQASLLGIVPIRPSRLLSRPQKIEVTHAQVRLKHKCYTIVHWSQVERISAHWLESPEFAAESRRYYQVAIAEGPDLWIFEDQANHYFLHGWFE